MTGVLIARDPNFRKVTRGVARGTTRGETRRGSAGIRKQITSRTETLGLHKRSPSITPMHPSVIDATAGTQKTKQLGCGNDFTIDLALPLGLARFASRQVVVIP